MKNKRSIPFLVKTLQKIAPKIGAKVLVEPKWGIVCQIKFKNGKKRYVRYNCIDLNSLGASEIAKDKDYANFFLRNMGYPTIKGKAFYSPSWAKAIGSENSLPATFSFADKIGYPLIIKPNSGSQGGGVALVHNRTELKRAALAVFKRDRIALLQKYIKGKDYRIVVLDNKVISAYERTPLSVIGDGVSSIKKLLTKKQFDFIKIDRDTKINCMDPRIKETLHHQGLNFGSVVPRGEKILLLTNANLSTGGDSFDVTDNIHKEFKKIAINITKDMGLRICGVDLMVMGDIKEKPNKYFVIEINSAPGLDHYVTTGKKQEKIVENLYLEVLRSMEK